jgi:negative regulator of flagellin synthesis FlgM
MKITHNKIGQNLNLSDLGKTETSKTDAAKNEKINAKKVNDSAAKELLQNSQEAVKVDLSNQAKDIRQVKELALAAPDIDMNKVEKFQKLIDEGKYKVDSKAVADRMIEDSMMMAGVVRSGEE